MPTNSKKRRMDLTVENLGRTWIPLRNMAHSSKVTTDEMSKHLLLNYRQVIEREKKCVPHGYSMVFCRRKQNAFE